MKKDIYLEEISSIEDDRGYTDFYVHCSAHKDEIIAQQKEGYSNNNLSVIDVSHLMTEDQKESLDEVDKLKLIKLVEHYRLKISIKTKTLPDYEYFKAIEDIYEGTSISLNIDRNKEEQQPLGSSNGLDCPFLDFSQKDKTCTQDGKKCPLFDKHFNLKDIPSG